MPPTSTPPGRACSPPPATTRALPPRPRGRWPSLRATDLLLDHADAWATLADVRTQAGDQSGARMARAEADRLYAARGSTLHSPGERTLVSDPDPPAPPSGSGAGSAENLASRKADNLATRCAHEYIARWAERGPDAVRDLLSEDLGWEDHR